MYGFNFIIRNQMRVSFFIDNSDKIYHWRKFKLDYNLDKFEVDLINDYGKDFIVETVKKMRVYERVKLDNLVVLQRFA